MLWKLAFLFLIGMFALMAFKARPKGDERAKPRRMPRFLRRRKRPPEVENAEKCPSCGAWVAPGARCACRDGG